MQVQQQLFPHKCHAVQNLPFNFVLVILFRYLLRDDINDLNDIQQAGRSPYVVTNIAPL